MNKRHIISFEEARALQESSSFGLLVHRRELISKNGTDKRILSIRKDAKTDLRVLNGFSQIIVSGTGVSIEE